VNEVLQTILNRRSVRAFKPGQIKREDVEAIVEAGLYAPSANNTQDWHFTVLQSQELIDKVNLWLLEEVNSSGDPHLQEIAKRNGGHFFRNAPTVIIVSTERNRRFASVNAAAATENMLIASESLGIGSCWIGSVEMLAISKNLDSYVGELRLPEGYAPQFGITLGYAASDSPAAPPRKMDAVFYP
jgi:nitroreductase